LEVVVVRPNTIIIQDLPVTVVPVVVVPVVEPQTGVTVVKEVRGRRDKVSMVHDLEFIGTPVVVGVPVRWVMAETVLVVVIVHGETVVMV
jgi:hypothetical protein